jgi:AcrR family transcriptional regulator
MAITREPLTRMRIVELALDIIDTEGLPALNMRRLAASAGVKPMSLPPLPQQRGHARRGRR